VVSAFGDADRGQIVLQVQDCGPGISPESQSRIFERFERAVRPGERTTGFGVGLWIVRQLAETMGGTITISSRTNEGSTFTVALPLPTPEDN
jgi:two-component system, OmpR family, sensor kinase